MLSPAPVSRKLVFGCSCLRQYPTRIRTLYVGLEKIATTGAVIQKTHSSTKALLEGVFCEDKVDLRSVSGRRPFSCEPANCEASTISRSSYYKVGVVLPSFLLMVPQMAALIWVVRVPAMFEMPWGPSFARGLSPMACRKGSGFWVTVFFASGYSRLEASSAFHVTYQSILVWLCADWTRLAYWTHGMLKMVPWKMWASTELRGPLFQIQ